MTKAQTRRSKSAKPATSTKKPAIKPKTKPATPKKRLTTTKSTSTAKVIPATTTPATPTQPAKKPKSTKLLKISLASGVLIGLMLVAFLFKQRRNQPVIPNPNNQRVAPATTDQPDRLKKASVTLLEGQAQVSSDNLSWTDLAAASELKDGQFIRTSEHSRLAITLSNGSIIRGNSNSLFRLVTLSPTETRLINLHGQIYSRIGAKPGHKYFIDMDSQSYTADEAAFLANKQAGASGVENYFGSIQISNHTASEGQRLYKTHPDTQLVDRVTPITPEQLATDPFMKWNYEQDKKLADFKDKLGFLKHLESMPNPPISVPSLPNSPVAPAQPVTIPGNSATSHQTSNPTAPQPATNEPPTPKPQPSGNLNLNHTGDNNFSWTIDGHAPHGFKLVWSSQDGPDGSVSLDAHTFSGSIPAGVNNYKVYVCATNDDNYCVIRSDSLEISLH